MSSCALKSENVGPFENKEYFLERKNILNAELHCSNNNQRQSGPATVAVLQLGRSLFIDTVRFCEDDVP